MEGPVEEDLTPAVQGNTGTVVAAETMVSPSESGVVVAEPTPMNTEGTVALDHTLQTSLDTKPPSGDVIVTESPTLGMTAPSNVDKPSNKSVGEAPVNESTVGESTISESTVGESTVSESTVSESTGESTVGESTFGESTVGEGRVSESTVGESTVGESTVTVGESTVTVGESTVTVGGSTIAESAGGESSVGESAGGEGIVGESKCETENGGSADKGDRESESDSASESDSDSSSDSSETSSESSSDSSDASDTLSDLRRVVEAATTNVETKEEREVAHQCLGLPSLGLRETMTKGVSAPVVPTTVQRLVESEKIERLGCIHAIIDDQVIIRVDQAVATAIIQAATSQQTPSLLSPTGYSSLNSQLAKSTADAEALPAEAMQNVLVRPQPKNLEQKLPETSPAADSNVTNALAMSQPQHDPPATLAATVLSSPSEKPASETPPSTNVEVANDAADTPKVAVSDITDTPIPAHTSPSVVCKRSVGEAVYLIHSLREKVVVEQSKGCDASGEHDQELDPSQMAYSDDEAESAAKRKLKQRKRAKKRPTANPSAEKRSRGASRGRGGSRGRAGSWGRGRGERHSKRLQHQLPQPPYQAYQQRSYAPNYGILPAPNFGPPPPAVFAAPPPSITSLQQYGNGYSAPYTQQPHAPPHPQPPHPPQPQIYSGSYATAGSSTFNNYTPTVATDVQTNTNVTLARNLPNTRTNRS